MVVLEVWRWRVFEALGLISQSEEQWYAEHKKCHDGLFLICLI
jgi:hypothetical protein